MKQIDNKLNIWLIFFIFLSNINYSSLAQQNDIFQINSTWHKLNEKTNDKFKVGKISTDTILYEKSINSFFYYQNLLSYLASNNIVDNIIRIINSQDYQILDKNFKDFSIIYNPQAYFIYRKLGEKKVHLVYTKTDCNIGDTIINPNFNFDYLLKQTNFKDFGSNFKKPLSYIGPYDGKAISISIATDKEIFSVHSYDFWQYENGKIKEFSEISGKKKTINEVRKLVKQLYEIGIIKDEVFETKCD